MRHDVLNTQQIVAFMHNELIQTCCTYFDIWCVFLSAWFCLCAWINYCRTNDRAKLINIHIFVCVQQRAEKRENPVEPSASVNRGLPICMQERSRVMIKAEKSHECEFKHWEIEKKIESVIACRIPCIKDGWNKESWNRRKRILWEDCGLSKYSWEVHGGESGWDYRQVFFSSSSVERIISTHIIWANLSGLRTYRYILWICLIVLKYNFPLSIIRRK